MSKKRPAHLQLEFGRPMKRVKLAHKPDVVSPVECTLPVQPECELGPFWITVGGRHSIVGEQRPSAAVEASLGSWALSLSLAGRSCSRPVADVEDEDTQDTASSGSEGSMKPLACYSPARQPRAAATGEEDSITSSQPHPAASGAFSFGSRPYLTPDLTAVECWDIVNGLLATM